MFPTTIQNNVQLSPFINQWEKDVIAPLWCSHPSGTNIDTRMVHAAEIKAYTKIKVY